MVELGLCDCMPVVGLFSSSLLKVLAGSVLVAILVFLIVNTRLSAENKISEVRKP
jgi:hypothetical protein